jgi:hypothetical protein
LIAARVARILLAPKERKGGEKFHDKAKQERQGDKPRQSKANKTNKGTARGGALSGQLKRPTASIGKCCY